MKKTLVIILIIIISIMNITFAEDSYKISKNDIVADSAILIDAKTGQILFQKNAHKKQFPASTTKLLTAIIIVEDCNLDAKITIDSETPFTEGSRIYVREGEIFTVRQLLNALLVDSANDAAVALAKFHSGSVEKFAEVMNERAKALGALNSNFVNPNGLPDDHHTTTAYDLAMIAKRAYQMPKIREITIKTRYQINPTNKVNETRYLKNSNKFLYGTGSSNMIKYRGKYVDIKYNLINGLKTGYTIKAQQCFVGSAHKNNMDLISVVLKTKGSNLYVDTRKLIDYGFNEFSKKIYFDKNEKIKEITLNNFKKSKVQLFAKDEIYSILPNDYSKTLLSTELRLSDIKLPIEKNDKLGEYLIYYDNKLINTFPLVSKNEVDNDMLLSDKTTYVDDDEFNYFDVLTIIGKILLAFILWRSMITIIKLKISR